jgi:signal transduction histidine kinase
MARRWMRPGIVGLLSGLLASVLMIAAVSGLLQVLKPYVPPLHLLVLYVPVVLTVAIVWGTRLAAVTALLSAVVFNYLLSDPADTLEGAGWRSAVALGVFLVTAVVVGELAARLQRAAEESARLSREQGALRRVATSVARGAPPAAIFTAVAKEVGQLFAAEFSSVVRYDPDGTSTVAGSWSRIGGTGAGDTVTAALGGRNATTLVFETGRSARIDRFADDDSSTGTPIARSQGPRSTVGAPISVEGRLWGALQVASPREAGLPVGTEERVADFAELVATAIANAEAKAQLQESRARIATSADETRRRIERDLHDGAQQQLVSLVLQLRAAQAAVPPELGEISAELDRVTTGLTDALDELREYARGIHPALLTDHGLGPALRTLARRCPLPVDLAMPTNGRLPEPVEVCAYYVISEALTNAAKHANASRIAVGVEAVTGVLRLSVRDDGTGGADFTHGTGLIGLKDRVEALGGRISLNSPPGAGTTLQVELPLTEADGVTSS